jgi:hypothetical protein
MINISSAALTYRLTNTEAIAATEIEKFTLASNDQGFTVTGLRVTVIGGAFGGTGSNYMACVLKKNGTVIATATLAADQGNNTSVQVDVSGGATGINPTFGPGDAIDLSLAETGTAVKSAGGINVHLLIS